MNLSFYSNITNFIGFKTASNTDKEQIQPKKNRVSYRRIGPIKKIIVLFSLLVLAGAKTVENLKPASTDLSQKVFSYTVVQNSKSNTEIFQKTLYSTEKDNGYLQSHFNGMEIDSFLDEKEDVKICDHYSLSNLECLELMDQVMYYVDGLAREKTKQERLDIIKKDLGVFEKGYPKEIEPLKKAKRMAVKRHYQLLKSLEGKYSFKELELKKAPLLEYSLKLIEEEYLDLIQALVKLDKQEILRSFRLKEAFLRSLIEGRYYG